MPNPCKHHTPHVLLLASRYDLSSDYVVAQLNHRQIPYFRLNTEDLPTYIIELDPITKRLTLESDDHSYHISPDTLRSVLFRRPVFLRDYGDDHRSPSERFSRFQWSAFIRNLILFKDARWLNHPVATYRAEHKAFQLSAAADLGFSVPPTRITNAPHPDSLGHGNEHVAIKGLDTVLLRHDGYEIFGYTTLELSQSLNPEAWRSAPATIQDALMAKLDIRVTVVESRVFAASVTVQGQPIVGDWRAHKRRTQFRPFQLPHETAERCRELVASLGLRMGAIDLALSHDKYYFLEINPTGEWAWLIKTAGLPIDQAIADALSAEDDG